MENFLEWVVEAAGVVLRGIGAFVKTLVKILAQIAVESLCYLPWGDSKDKRKKK